MLDGMLSSATCEGNCHTSFQVTHLGLQAYSSLGTQWVMRGVQPNPVLSSAVIEGIAQQHNVSSAQVVLRWALQHGQVRP